MRSVVSDRRDNRVQSVEKERFSAMRQRERIVVCALLLLLTRFGLAADKCEVGKFAELPVTMEGTKPVVTGQVNGAEGRFHADSGAFYSMLSKESAERFKLRLSELPWRFTLQGVGGSETAMRTTVKEFSLNGYHGKTIHDIEFIVIGNAVAPGVDGIIGQNVLGAADTEFDLANGVIRLFVVRGCSHTSLAYWSGTQSVSVLEIEPTSPTSPHLIGKAKLNGANIRVILDTGASFSILALKAARRAGFNVDDTHVKPAGVAHGVGSRSIDTWIAPFDVLEIGDEQIKRAPLRVGDFEPFDGTDMLLGADFFLSHRLYVSHSQQKVFFTFNGGHVFDLSVARNTPGEANTDGTKTETAVLPAVPLDAAALRRRGMASAGRGNLRAAMTDLDEAVRQDPSNAENFYQRGQIRARSQQLDLAREDYEQALKISPGDVEALMARGALRLQDKDVQGAAADFATAMIAAPSDAELPLRTAIFYQGAGQSADAIHTLDPWISAHARDDRLPEALNLRCRIRAISGQELDQALADCNAALKHGPKNSAYLDNRALVWLRLGNIDRAIADWSESAHLQPKSSGALFGLGVAEHRKGLSEKGDSHQREAIALNPKVADAYKKMGIEP